MKKIFLLLTFILFIDKVNATTNITEDTELKFKWYKDNITESLYYPKKDNLPDYFEDETKIEYDEYSGWSSEYCNYSKDYYVIENKVITTYDKLDKVKYIRLNNASTTCQNITCIDEIKIYYNHEELSHKILSNNYRGILIELPNYYEPEKLLFYLDTTHLNVIYLSKNKDIPPITISSPASAEKIRVLDDNWQATDESYINMETEGEVPNIPLIKNIKRQYICRIKEIKTYRYKIEREYYDDNYYTYLENYTPDINDYVIYYTKELPKHKEIIKEVIVPKIEKEYVYLNDENNNECESLTNNEEKVIYKTKYIDKIKNKIPLIGYVIFIALFLIIIFLIIKILTKKVV